MKTIVKVTFLMGALSFAVLAFADANVADWTGKYAMNHDGWVGTLSITDTKADCASSPWCALALNYVDGKGKKVRGRIEKIDQKLQHMVFFLEFPDHKQKFDAYLFSWDKTKMAGTTYWNGRTFGFYAIQNKK